MIPALNTTNEREKEKTTLGDCAPDNITVA
jgi:hypothetical protein